MVTTLLAPASRRIGQIAAVGAEALVLAGTMATTAKAMKRRDATTDADYVIGMCFCNGGTPDSYEYGSTIYVSCTLEDGPVETFDFPYR